MLNITKIFKSDLLTQPFIALKNVSFEIPRGAMVGFLGANGAGKTTSLKIMMDFIRPDSGEVIFAPDLGMNKMEVFKKIGFLPERPYFYQNLKGKQFLFFMGSLSEVPKSQIEQRIKKWAPVFRIDHALDREIRTYSKGMLQRIGFLSAIIHEPEFIILDEPLSGLDPIGRKELKDVIVNVHKEGKTVFFSSHIVPDIEEICDRVIFLKEGSLIYQGPVSTLLRSNNKLTFTAKYRSLKKIDFGNLSGQHSVLAEDLYTFKFEEDFRSGVIQKILNSDAQLVGLEEQKPNLEEIFYSTKAGNV